MSNNTQTFHESWDNGALNCLECLLDNTTITDWEGEFVDSLFKQRESGRPLSKKQRTLLFKIYAEKEL